MILDKFLILPKRLSGIQKEEIIKKFSEGATLEELSKEFNFTKLTISRNLKKNLGEKIYKSLANKNHQGKELLIKGNKIDLKDNIDLGIEYSPESNGVSQKNHNEDDFQTSSFIEITPLNQEIDNTIQKDLSSVPLSEINLPNLVYMIVDKKIELETKQLKDYPDWQFLPLIDLDRKTIEIFFDIKIAKRFCNKDHKVIKVPNTNVFKIVAPILRSRGITRIVTEDKLIAL